MCMILIIAIIHFEQFRVPFICDKNMFIYFEYGYNAFGKKSFKMSKISSKFMILDFKNVFNHNHVLTKLSFLE